MCDGCGNYHLTKASRGGNGPLPDGKFTVGSFESKAPNHPVFARTEPEEPIIPGDHETRLRFAREFLITNPEPTSEQMCEAIGGCTKDTLRKVMKDLGYRNTRGRHARWVKNEPADERTPLDLEYDNDAPEKPTRWHGGRDIPWREARLVEGLDRLRHIALGDLIDTYAAAGLRLVLSLEDADA
ncbi:DNA binding protein [Microbacterium phage Jayden]|uniref:DNA binding protein n=1 Tax=Microbacterium phage Jayden TaxID=2656550 RepID=A0A649VRY8_9CAUD|nr:DNA binding protein [Microbacterium phage Jayden]QGJ95287.1 DNA binding protein [Microbacterium phage Jayden]